MRFSGAAIALSLNALVAHAETRDLPPECSGWPEKPAWEWTLEERIRHRLDPDCRRRLAILAEIADVQKLQCAERIEAFERTRRALPPGSFDRFPYVAVTPGIGSSAQIVTSESLRWRGERCQEAGGP